MFGPFSQHDEEGYYARAGQRVLNGDRTTSLGNYFEREFQKSLDRNSAAMERLAAALENQSRHKRASR